jgi:hypothetical protein
MEWKLSYAPYVLEDIDKALERIAACKSKVRNDDAKLAMSCAESALEGAKGVLQQISEEFVGNIVGWEKAVALAQMILACDEKYNRKHRET